MSEQTQTMTAAAETPAGELRTEIRRGERLLEHYRRTGQRVCERMMERDLERARAAMGIGNIHWMKGSVETLRGYEE